jgi:hypothetical protein
VRRFNKQMRTPFPRGEFSKGVGVVSHKELNLDDDETSHTRGEGEDGTQGEGCGEEARAL